MAPVYDFSSGFAGLNRGIATLGKGMQDAYDWEQGEKIVAQMGLAPAAAQAPSMSIGNLGQPAPVAPVDTPRAPSFAAVEGSRPSATAEGLAANQGGQAQQAVAFLASKGWTPAQAAGIVGNLQAESGKGLKTDAVGDNGSAFGIAQWRLDRQQALRQFAKQSGKDPSDFMTQLAFLDTELRGPEKFAGEAIRAAQTPQDAAIATIHALRPSGYTRDNPAGGHNATVRAQNALALAGGSPADMPAQGAHAAQGFVVPGQGAARGAGVPPQMKAMISEMVRNPQTRAAGFQMWQQALKGGEVKTVDLGGSIGIMDNQGNILRQIPKDKAPAAPIAVGRDSVLVDPTDGREIYRGQPRPGARPMTQEEKAAFGVPENTGGYIDADGKPVTLRGTGGVKVDNNMPGDHSALRKKLSEKEGEVWGKHLEAGTVSGGLTQDFQVLDELMKVAPQGPITGRLAEMFPGVSTAGTAFQSIVTRVAPSLRTPGSGATSDIEYEGMLKSLPKLSNRPEANALIAETMKAKADVNVRRGQIVAGFQNGQIDESTARQQLSELDKTSILSPRLKQLLGTGQTPQYDRAALEAEARRRGLTR